MRTISDILLGESDRAAIEEAAALLRERFPIEEIVLFGSKAKGTDTAESDIDLLLITSSALSWRERGAMTDALFDIELSHDVVISTLVVSREDWTAGPFVVLPIRHEIELYGVAA